MQPLLCSSVLPSPVPLPRTLPFPLPRTLPRTLSFTLPFSVLASIYRLYGTELCGARGTRDPANMCSYLPEILYDPLPARLLWIFPYSGYYDYGYCDLCFSDFFLPDQLLPDLHHALPSIVL